MLAAIARKVRQNPYPLYGGMRRLFPVVRVPGAGAWAVFDYPSVKQVLLDSQCFSSAAAPPGRQSPDWLLFKDPPHHTRLRAIVARAFTRRSIQALEPRVRALSGELLERRIPHRSMDFVADYAALLPAMVIAELFAIAPGYLGRVLSWTEAIANLSHSIAGGTAATRAVQRYQEMKAQMREYLCAAVESRRRQAGDDLLAHLVHAEVDGERLTLEEILGFFELLLSAGTDTVSGLISNALVCLLDNPDEYRRLTENPALLGSAIEEVLRFRSPAQMVFRQTLRPVELHRRAIPAGKLVLAMIGCANRDPEVFTDADRFDVARNPNPHIAFGHGIHFCIGAGLARLEARVALEDVFARLANIRRLRPGAWEPREALHLHGPRFLPVAFDPLPE